MEKKKEEKVEKKEEKKTVEDPYKDFLKDMKVTSEKKNSSKQTVESFAQGIGFKTLQGSSEQSCKIVKRPYAKQSFQDLIKRCMMLIPSQKQFLVGFMNDFSKAIESDFERRIFMEIDEGKKHITLIKLFFYKKPKHCLMSHRVLSLDYSLSPNVLKIGSLKEKSSSIGVKLGSFAFSSSSSSSESKQTLQEKERGLTHQDLENLMLLATLDNTNLLRMLDQIHNDKVQEVDY